MLYQMQNTRGLYLHTCSRVFKNCEGSINLFHLSIQKLKVPSISIVQCLFRYVLLMPTKFSCLAAAWDLAPCPHFHYLPNDLLHHQAGDRKGKVSNFRWLRDRKIGSGILSSSDYMSRNYIKSKHNSIMFGQACHAQTNIYLAEFSFFKWHHLWDNRKILTL